ncbi:hypothetical protein TEK04_00945 [Klenkia sp. LSe6-5]|uniref:AMIN-like domain-containing protein n=1 Tax=Klenkia sesuvii TaxID=3103137 RepID=A0ABU8DNG8_9ACTN
MRRTALTRGLVAVPLSTLVLLAGCGGGEAQEAGSSTGSTSSAAATGSAAGATTPTSASTTVAAGDDGGAAVPAFPAEPAPVSADPVAGEGPTVVTDVRLGAQDGFGRVVFDVSGDAVPGWDVAYTDAPSQQGSGTALEVPGTTFLRVTLTRVTNPYAAPGVTEAAPGVYGPQTGPVSGVYFDSTFEGQALAYVGLTQDRPFRVYSLSNPTRIVVDVQS